MGAKLSTRPVFFISGAATPMSPPDSSLGKHGRQEVSSPCVDSHVRVRAAQQSSDGALLFIYLYIFFFTVCEN